MVFKKLKSLSTGVKNIYNQFIKNQEPDSFPSLSKPKEKSKEAPTFVKISQGDVAIATITIIAVVALSFLIYNVLDILMLFFVSLLFAASLDPTITQLQKYKIPRSLSVLVIFSILIVTLSFFIISFVPILANELISLGQKTTILIENIAKGQIDLPPFLEWLNPFINEMFGSSTANVSLNIQNFLLNFGFELKSVAGNTVTAISSVSNGLANFVLVLLLTYFMIVDRDIIEKFVYKLFPSKYKAYIAQKNSIITLKVGQWLRGQIGLMLAVGIVTYIGLLALGIDYAFTLALFAGITEVIPVVGPIIGWVAAIPIAANISLSAFIWVSILYFAVQRLENNLLVPVIMKQSTGLHPIIVLLAMLVGFEFYGVLGVIISVPVSAIIAIFLEDYLVKDK